MAVGQSVYNMQIWQRVNPLLHELLRNELKSLFSEIHIHINWRLFCIGKWPIVYSDWKDSFCPIADAFLAYFEHGDPFHDVGVPMLGRSGFLIDIYLPCKSVVISPIWSRIKTYKFYICGAIMPMHWRNTSIIWKKIS